MKRFAQIFTFVLIGMALAQDPVVAAVIDRCDSIPGYLQCHYTVDVDGVAMTDAEGNVVTIAQHVPVAAIDAYVAEGDTEPVARGKAVADVLNIRLRQIFNELTAAPVALPAGTSVPPICTFDADLEAKRSTRTALRVDVPLLLAESPDPKCAADLAHINAAIALHGANDPEVLTARSAHSAACL